MKPGPLRYPVSEPLMGRTEVAAVTRCVASGWVSSLGPDVAAFESEFAAYCGARHGVALSTGTAALHLALVALGIGRGDDVIVPDMTFVATANAVAYTGARVVTADVDPLTWNLDPRSVAGRITRRTKAILPVHLFGFPADMRGIRRASGGTVPLIEDAAESHGATLGGVMTGTIGVMGCFSFYANKAMTMGEGGFLAVRGAALARRIRFLRDHAMDPDRRYYHPEVGFNYRLTGLQAALGRAQLGRLDDILRRKRRNAAAYRERLADIPGLEFQQAIPGAVSSEWMVSVLLPPGLDRARVAADLRAAGIDSRPFFHPISSLPMFRQRRGRAAAMLHERGLTLPSSALLRESDIEIIAGHMRRICGGSGRARRR